MTARGRWRARLAAGGAGLAINAGLLALLTLERRTPSMADPPTVVVALEPRPVPPKVEPDRRTAPPRQAGPPSPAPPRLQTSPSSVAPLVLPTVPAGPSMSQAVEPRWRVGGGEYLDPASARRARRLWEAAEDRRYKRACLGQSSEHMTEEETFACWDAWGGGAPMTGPGGRRPGRSWPGLPADPPRIRPGSPSPASGTPPG
jgi:hypothetical protein